LRVVITHVPIPKWESKRGASPSFLFFPLSLIGEGDTGGEVDKRGRKKCFDWVKIKG